MPRKIFKIKKHKMSFLKINIFDYIIFIIFLISLFIIFNLYKIQIISGKKYNEIVVAQNQGYFTSALVKNRGNIFFHDGDHLISVASQRYGYTLAVVPKNILNKEKVILEISKIINIDKKKIRDAISKGGGWKEIKKRISEEKAKKIISKKLKGVVLVKESWRVYPFDSTASKIIGSLGYDDHDKVKIVGKYGLEKYYNKILDRSSSVESKKIFDLFFQKNKLDKVFSAKKISKEGNLISSIDINVSRFLEKTLKNIDKKYHSEYSIGIIIKPDSGEVVAMSDSRSINFNKEKKHYTNPFVENKYEFGSIFKPVVASIGLELNSITKNFSYYDKGCIKILSYTICNYDRKGRGMNTSLQRVITESLNTGMIEIERKIGHRNFFNFLLESGFAEETGVDLPGEVSTNFSSLSTFNDANFATASFGQGISFTPIGISRVLSTLANNGYIITPHIISKVEYGDLIPDTIFESKKKKIFSNRVNKIMRDILVKRTDKIDSKKPFVNRDYSVAAKTGTAQIANPNGGYYKNKYLHSFFGFFPAYAEAKDRYMILIFTKNPKDVKYSYKTLTEPFYKIVNFLISYYNIAPDRATISN